MKFNIHDLRKCQYPAIVFGIVLLSFLLSLLCWTLEPTVSRDGALYLDLIQTWHDGENFQAVLKHWPGFWIPPLPLYLINLLMDCGLSAEAAGFGLNIALGCFLPLIVYEIAMEITRERRIALCSALLMALNPSMLALAIEVQRDMIYLFFCGLFLIFLVRGIRRQKWVYWMLAGVFFVCSLLTRFETLEFVPLLSFSFLFLLLARYIPWKKALLHASIFLFSLAATLFLLIYTMGVHDHLFIKSYWKHYLQDKVKTGMKMTLPQLPAAFGETLKDSRCAADEKQLWGRTSKP